MREIFDSLIAGQRAGQLTEQLTGRVLGLKWAVVMRTDDPLQLHRIQVLEPEKGGKTPSDWLMRMVLFPGLSCPLPKVGDTALIGYINGDAHYGAYFGVINNQVNPPLSNGTNLVLQVGQVTVTITPDGSVNLSGVTTLTCDAPNVQYSNAQQVSFNNVNSFTVNSKQIATVGAKDSRGDVLVNKGW